MKKHFSYAAPGILRSKDNRAVRYGLAKAAASKKITKLLPGVYCQSHLENDPLTLAAAALIYNPNFVLLGEIAAKLQFMPDLKPELITAACQSAQFSARQYPKFRFTRASIPDDLKTSWGSGFVAAPEISVFHMSLNDDYSALCEALRRKVVSAESLIKAYQRLPERSSLRNLDCVTKARGNPWSLPELEMQELLSAFGITGWRGNITTKISGRNFILDIAFEEQKVAIEIDSEKYHLNQTAFHEDRSRHNLLTAEGWIVLHITPRAIRRSPKEVIKQVASTLKCRSLQ